MKMQADDQDTGSTRMPWIRRMAWALPLFFLIKGLMWLTVPTLYLVFTLE